MENITCHDFSGILTMILFSSLPLSIFTALPLLKGPPFHFSYLLIQSLVPHYSSLYFSPSPTLTMIPFYFFISTVTPMYLTTS